MSKTDLKFYGGIVLAFVVAAFIARKFIDFLDSRKNATDASNSTAGSYGDSNEQVATADPNNNY